MVAHGDASVPECQQSLPAGGGATQYSVADSVPHNSSASTIARISMSCPPGDILPAAERASKGILGEPADSRRV